MVLSHPDRDPYDNDSSDNEDDPWELIGDEIASAIAATVPGGAECESSLEVEPLLCVNEENGSLISGVSSITRDHPSFTDREDDLSEVDSQQESLHGSDGEFLARDADEPPAQPSPAAEATNLRAPIPSVSEDISSMFSGLVGSLCAMGFEKEKIEQAVRNLLNAGIDKIIDADSVINEITSEMDDSTAGPLTSSACATGSNISGGETSSEHSDLVVSLSSMGFEKEQIEQAVDDLRGAGSEIDADSVIGKMTGEIHNPGHAWDFIHSTIPDFEPLRRRAQHRVDAVGRSARELFSVAQEESQRCRDNFRNTCKQAHVCTRAASVEVKHATSSVKDAICRANEEHRILEKVAVAAVAGGALLVALGNPRAGVGAMAVAGSSMMVGEAMKHSAAHSPSTCTRDYGLREGVHLD